MPLSRPVVLGITALGCLIVSSRAADRPPRNLVEFGWDEPGTGFLREHIQEMQRTPFDGCVFHADYRRADGRKGSFTWEGWGTNAFTEADLRGAFDDLAGTRLGRFNLNFLRFNTTPARHDWFDDYSCVIQNAQLAARLARASHGPGVLLDIEQYESPLFNYRKLRDAKTKSWELYAAQCRRRGREVMAALQQGYPGLTVLLTFGYSLPWQQSKSGQVSLADCSYGLLAPFLDGMVAAAEGGARLVDGCELAYGFKERARFEETYRAIRDELLPIVRDADKYRRVVSCGFGLWLDRDWRKNGWNTEDLTRNYFTPESFEASARHALDVTDEYVWIYSETPRWWSAEGAAVKLPDAYANALARARSDSAKRATP